MSTKLNYNVSKDSAYLEFIVMMKSNLETLIFKTVTIF